MKNEKIEDNKLSWEKEKTLRQIWASLPLEDAQAFASAMKFVIDYNYEQGKKDGAKESISKTIEKHAKDNMESAAKLSTADQVRKQLLDEIMGECESIKVTNITNRSINPILYGVDTGWNDAIDSICKIIKSKYKQ